jgi:7-cyano-7-deazaguanine reductase
MSTTPSKNLETFPNPHPGRDYIIEIECPEFTCLCPKTGQPDFATLSLEYVPDALCVELKSLKLYVWSYRNEGHFHEDVTNRILNDLVAAAQPRYMRLRAKFYVRGGIYTTVEVEHRLPGWRSPPPPPSDIPRVKKALPEKETGNETPPAAVDTPPAPAMEKPQTAAKRPAPVATTNSRFRMLARARQFAPETAETGAETETPAPTASSRKPVQKDGIYIGIDLGTTGCRAIAIDIRGKQLAEANASIPAPTVDKDHITQDPALWLKATTDVLKTLLKQIDPNRVCALAVDGTSGTLLLCDAKGNPLAPAIMYNDQRAVQQAGKIAAVANPSSGAQGTSSSLAKLLWWQEQKLDKKAVHALHQSDWISGRLMGVFKHSDYNNCLKLGFDPEKMAWPAWLSTLGVNTGLLPEVHGPGETLGTVSADIAKTFGFPVGTKIVAGTTDGVAAFLAAGATEPGQGVTSLGTTLVLKLLSDKPIFSAKHGVYSHRLGRYWLAGGASNSGGGVLQQYFNVEQMREMTPMLDPENSTGLNYYPLPGVGERFPVNNPEMQPKLEPLPGDSVSYFQGMLEGITHIEAQGYALLEELGAPALTAVFTTGGGAANPAWERIRERTLQVKMMKAHSSHAAYGTALLAAGIIVKTFK